MFTKLLIALGIKDPPEPTDPELKNRVNSVLYCMYYDQEWTSIRTIYQKGIDNAGILEASGQEAIDWLIKEKLLETDSEMLFKFTKKGWKTARRKFLNRLSSRYDTSLSKHR